MQNGWTTSDFEATTWLLLARWLSFPTSMVMPFRRELYEMNIGELWGATSFLFLQSQALFLFDYSEQPNPCTKQKCCILFGQLFRSQMAKCVVSQFQSCSQATRLSRGLQTMLGVGGSVRQAWGFFWELGNAPRIRGSVHHDLLTISLVFSLFPGMNFYGLRIWEVFVMVGNWDLIFSSFWTALDFGGSLQKLCKNLPGTKSQVVVDASRRYLPWYFFFFTLEIW